MPPAAGQQPTLTVPIVHISATFLSDRAEQLAYEGGADSYLTDPVEPAVLLATIHSLLRLRRAEEGLRAASREWQATFDAIGDGICLLAPDGTVARCNVAFATLLDPAPADLVGRPWAEIWRRLGGAEEQSPTARVERTRRRETFDLQREQGWFRLLVDPVLEGESVTGLVCIVTDVTIERQAADVRAALFAREQEAREEAEASNRAKDEFLAMLGHELRNPLDVIGTAVRVLDAQPDRDATTRRARGVIARQVLQLGQLVDDLLDVGRVTTGKIQLVKVPVNLADTVQRSVAGLMPPGEAPQHRITVRAEPIWVEADQARVEQIVMNLLSNAVKYTPPAADRDLGDRRRAPGAPRGPRHRRRDDALHDRARLRPLLPGRADPRAGRGWARHRADPGAPPRRDARRARRGPEPGQGRGTTVTVELPQLPEPASAAAALARPAQPEAHPDRRGQSRQPRHAPLPARACGPRGARGPRRAERGGGHPEGPPGHRAGRRRAPGLDGYEVARRVRADAAGGRSGWWPSPAMASRTTTGARRKRASTPTW